MGGMVSTGDRRRPAGPHQGYLRRDSTLTIAKALRPLGYRNYMAGNTPFRYYKSWGHEGGITSPSIHYFPSAGLTAGKVISSPAHLIDIMPTLLKLAGQNRSLPGNLPLPGINLLPLIREEIPAEARTLFCEHQGNRAIRQGDWKLVAASGETWELYNLRTDRTKTLPGATPNGSKLCARSTKTGRSSRV